MSQTEHDLQRMRDKERLNFLNKEIRSIVRDIQNLNHSLHFKQIERSNIEYRLYHSNDSSDSSV